MNDEWDSTYRLPRHYRDIGIVTTAVFLCAWAGAVLMAYFNVDGSFARPASAIAFFSVVLGGFTLLGVWLILAYVKYRLFLNNTTICEVGLLSSTAIPLDTVQELRWRLVPQSCVLTSLEGKIKIGFGNFAKAEQTELIGHLRGRISENRQTDWDAFHDRFLAPSPERTRRQQLSNRVRILTLFGFALIFVVLWLRGRGVFLLVVALVNVLGGGCVILLDRRRRRAGQSAESDAETDAVRADRRCGQRHPPSF